MDRHPDEMTRDELVEAYRAGGWPQPEELADIELAMRRLRTLRAELIDINRELQETPR